MTMREIDLMITGQRLQDHHLIRVRGKSAWLTPSNLRVLAALVSARGAYIADDTVAYPVAVCRLRRTFQRALGHPRGKSLIETGAGREYRLKPGTVVAVERALLSCLERTEPELAERLREADVEWVDDEEPNTSRLQLAA